MRDRLFVLHLRLVVAVVVVTAATPLNGEPVRFSFSRLDRTYSSFVEELAPIELSSLRVVLRSPDHSMTLESHFAELDALGSSLYETRVGFQFHGFGVLDADVSIGAVESRVQDEIELPQQALRLSGRVRVDPSAEGYTITLVESYQETADVQIESKLAGRIVPLCKQLALVLVSLPCDVLEDSLSVVRVPIPEPGTRFFLSRGELTEVEAKALDAFLEEGAAPRP